MVLKNSGAPLPEQPFGLQARAVHCTSRPAGRLTDTLRAVVDWPNRIAPDRASRGPPQPAPAPDAPRRGYGGRAAQALSAHRCAAGEAGKSGWAQVSVSGWEWAWEWGPGRVPAGAAPPRQQQSSQDDNESP